MHPPLHDVTAAVVIVGIVIGVVRIIVIVVVGIRPIESEAAHKCSPMESMAETTSVETITAETITVETSS
jgi:hypothetical protein